MFQVGDEVQVNTGGHGGRLWEDGVVDVVRVDGKLCVLVDRVLNTPTGATVRKRRVVRGMAFVRARQASK